MMRSPAADEVDEINRLKSKRIPLCETVDLHRNMRGELAPCCASCMSSFRSSIVAAASRYSDGMQGVLSYVQDHYAWGVVRCRFLCDMMQHPAELDCGACTALALLALQIYLQHAEAARLDVPLPHVHRSTGLAVVEVVQRVDPADMGLAREKLKELYGRSATQYDSWIEDHHCYHKCPGLYSTDTLRLLLWDFSTWMTQQHDPDVALHAIVAMRVTLHRQGGQKSEPTMLTWADTIRVPVGQWVDLTVSRASPDSVLESIQMPALEGALFGALPPISPVSLIHRSHRRLAKDEIVASMFRPSSRCSLNPECAGDDARHVDLSLKVFISGCHMSANPMPGVGVARSLRSWMRLARQPNDSRWRPRELLLVGVDDVWVDSMSGIVDPVFDGARSLQAMGYMHMRRFNDSHLSTLSLSDAVNTLKDQQLEDQALWDAVVDMVVAPTRVPDGTINDSLNSFNVYLPAWVQSLSGPYDGALLLKYRLAVDRIICPPMEALRLTVKPYIRGAVSMQCFKIPAYFLLPAARSKGSADMGSTLVDVQHFCDTVGYPVVVKGVQMGSVLCFQWANVLSRVSSQGSNSRQQDIFVQQFIPGCEKGIAFAAVRGELTGCLLMTKHVSTTEGKVWVGSVSVVPAGVIEKLAEFVASCGWTGAGELEFIETIDSALHGASSGSSVPCWYIIDFNTRFPAWINACIYTGCNLVADLFTHYMTFETEVCRKVSAEDKWSFAHYSSFKTTEYVKSIIEMPVVNVNNGRKGTFLHISQESVHKGAASQSEDSNHNSRCLDETTTGRPDAFDSVDDPALIAQSEVVSRLRQDLKLVCAAASAYLKSDGVNRAPTYVMSQQVVSAALTRHDSIIWTGIHAVNTCNSALNTKLPLELRMSLSVKTQPRREVLELAKKAGYMAECISMAEVRLALAVGFEPRDVILTGPGKFWDGFVAVESPRENIESLVCAPLGAIFADSVSELISIIRRVSDPNDWLRADLIGVRFQPVGNPFRSRFGIDGTDVGTFRATAAIVQRFLPQDVKLGVHLHFASSAPSTGLRAWFGMAKAAAAMAGDFSRLSGRLISVLDFGGGFHSHFLDHKDTLDELSSLFEHVRQQCSTELGDESHSPLLIQFELGKCISERSSGLVCQVLGLREVGIGSSRGGELCWDDAHLSDENIRLLLARPFGGISVQKRAIIVDACVGDISDHSHAHPIYWRPKDNVSGSSQWTPLMKGTDEVWGRTCMEFDVLYGSCGGWGTRMGSCGAGCGGVTLPHDIQPGDYILIGCCGAYDMSMQYDFGDGKGRKCFVHDELE